MFHPMSAINTFSLLLVLLACCRDPTTARLLRLVQTALAQPQPLPALVPQPPRVRGEAHLDEAGGEVSGRCRGVEVLGEHVAEVEVVQDHGVEAAGPGGQLLVHPDLGRQVDHAAPDLHGGRLLDGLVDVPGVAGGEAAHEDDQLSAGVRRHVPQGLKDEAEGVL